MANGSTETIYKTMVWEWTFSTIQRFNRWCALWVWNKISNDEVRTREKAEKHEETTAERNKKGQQIRENSPAKPRELLDRSANKP